MAVIERKTLGERVFDAVIYILLAVVAIICIYPMIHVFFASISDPIELISHTGPIWRPLGFSLKGYKIVLNNPNISVGYLNTIIYVVIGTAINLLMTSLGAYALSREGYKLRKFFTVATVFTMYFGGGLIPTFLLVKGLGLLDSRLAMIIPSAIGTWNLIVMKTVFSSVPKSLEESAKIDGANDFIILFKIFIPVSKATMAVMLLFYAVGHWNSWFDAMIYLQNRKLFPLQLFLREILISNSMIGNSAAGAGGLADAGSDFFFMEELIKYSTIIISTVPILCIYPFIQKHFTKGVMLGSLKG